MFETLDVFAGRLGLRVDDINNAPDSRGRGLWHVLLVQVELNR